ncbi:hypothetical protein ADK67_42030 [Saccharothrix sp. NRRL B-16348]|uniref:hypothetical protein n=1 Tax=Saccharothrix sp. NRRL B-16348 TaxID=1415542 RepID=UPI0006AF5D1F|nr:hypothetical protein [Saccharothrix sp. NRRL B-16348]KOX14538.1 hypothetical protein ADK67_42030 [Saccharothrix sp. NRRL B-16348]
MERVDIPAELRGHVIVTGADGEILDTSPAEDVAAMLTEAMKSERAVLHFHGGLVPEKSGLAIARNLLPVYKAADNAYPIFVVRKSGPMEILRGNLESILREELFNSRKIMREPAPHTNPVTNTAALSGDAYHG